MTKPSVVVENLGKKFGISLRSALKYGLTDSFRRLLGGGKDTSLRQGEFWALKEVDFTLEPGDSLGIMGINGSGKTTLLRILNGTYTPDSGQAMLRGRVGALIAAGAGFSPMLTGRENIYINGTLLGMTPDEIRKKFDEIVDFAELDDFIDMPVRNYSSGMAVRLGFAVAVIGTPEILLVDEVLAVGDINFQKKCFERIDALKREGTTILLVSHAPGAIWAVCNKGLVLHHGLTDGIVSVEAACKDYDHFNMLERMRHQPVAPGEDELPSEYGQTRGGTGEAFITKVQVLDASGQAVESLPYGQPFTLRCNIKMLKSFKDCMIRFLVDAEINKAIAIIDNYEVHGRLFDLEKGHYTVDIVINNPRLRPGVYTFSAAIVQKIIGVHIFFEYNLAKLCITQPEDIFFYADLRASVHLDSTYNFSQTPSSALP